MSFLKVIPSPWKLDSIWNSLRYASLLFSPGVYDMNPLTISPSSHTRCLVPFQACQYTCVSISATHRPASSNLVKTRWWPSYWCLVVRTSSSLLPYWYYFFCLYCIPEASCTIPWWARYQLVTCYSMSFKCCIMLSGGSNGRSIGLCMAPLW